MLTLHVADLWHPKQAKQAGGSDDLCGLCGDAWTSLDSRHAQRSVGMTEICVQWIPSISDD